VPDSAPPKLAAAAALGACVPVCQQPARSSEEQQQKWQHSARTHSGSKRHG